MFVTLDLFSALIDSRAGGAVALDRIAASAGHRADGAALYDEWDARNKASQRDLDRWMTFAEHSRRALAETWAVRGWDAGEAGPATVALLESVPDWPLWPDVADAVPLLRRDHRVGVLSNVDDAVFARTRVAALLADADLLSSERLGAYKPDRQFYRSARAAGVDLHVPASARDTRGALEAGLTVVRVDRPGHTVDPDGPQPARTVPDLHALVGELAGFS